MSQFTKKAIMETFMALLEKKPLDKITVKDIIEGCDISRGTFYYYYQDIYELVEDILETEAQQLVGDADICETWQEGFLKATQLARASKRQLYHAYHAVSRAKLEQYLQKISAGMMRAFVDREAVGLTVPEEDKAFITHFYVCALVGITLDWISDGMQVDPELYINKMGTLFDGNIRMALEKSSRRSVDGKN